MCRNVALLLCVQGWMPRLQLLLMSHAAFFVLHLQVCLISSSTLLSGILTPSQSHQTCMLTQAATPPVILSKWLVPNMYCSTHSHQLVLAMQTPFFAEVVNAKHASCKTHHISLLMLTATTLFFAIVADIQLQHSWCPAAMPRCSMLSGVENEMQAVGALQTHEHLYQAMLLLWWVF